MAAARLPAGDVEVRFWIVPSFGRARGVVIRKSGSDFRAIVIDASGARTATPAARSWETTWDALSDDGIFTLPDDSSLPRDGQYILDGVVYTVEVQRDGAYRSYSYGNPAYHEWPEATRVLHMAHVLARAFRVRIDDRSAAVRARVPDDDVDASSHAMGAACDPFDMSQSRRCGANGRLHFGSADGTTVLVGDIAEMGDDQRLWVQKELGLPSNAPLRTIDAWRSALR